MHAWALFLDADFIGYFEKVWNRVIEINPNASFTPEYGPKEDGYMPAGSPCTLDETIEMAAKAILAKRCSNDPSFFITLK